MWPLCALLLCWVSVSASSNYPGSILPPMVLNETLECAAVDSGTSNHLTYALSNSDLFVRLGLQNLLNFERVEAPGSSTRCHEMHSRSEMREHASHGAQAFVVLLDKPHVPLASVVGQRLNISTNIGFKLLQECAELVNKNPAGHAAGVPSAERYAVCLNGYKTAFTISEAVRKEDASCAAYVDSMIAATHHVAQMNGQHWSSDSAVAGGWEFTRKLVMVSVPVFQLVKNTSTVRIDEDCNILDPSQLVTSPVILIGQSALNGIYEPCPFQGPLTLTMTSGPLPASLLQQSDGTQYSGLPVSPLRKYGMSLYDDIFHSSMNELVHNRAVFLYAASIISVVMLGVLLHANMRKKSLLAKLCGCMFAFDLVQCGVLLYWQHQGFPNACHWYSVVYHCAWVGALTAYATAVSSLHQRVRDPFSTISVVRPFVFICLAMLLSTIGLESWAHRTDPFGAYSTLAFCWYSWKDRIDPMLFVWCPLVGLIGYSVHVYRHCASAMAEAISFSGSNRRQSLVFTSGFLVVNSLCFLTLLILLWFLRIYQDECLNESSYVWFGALLSARTAGNAAVVLTLTESARGWVIVWVGIRLCWAITVNLVFKCVDRINWCFHGCPRNQRNLRQWAASSFTVGSPSSSPAMQEVLLENHSAGQRPSISESTGFRSWFAELRAEMAGESLMAKETTRTNQESSTYMMRSEVVQLVGDGIQKICRLLEVPEAAGEHKFRLFWPQSRSFDSSMAEAHHCKELLHSKQMKWHHCCGEEDEDSPRRPCLESRTEKNQLSREIAALKKLHTHLQSKFFFSVLEPSRFQKLRELFWAQSIESKQHRVHRKTDDWQPNKHEISDEDTQPNGCRLLPVSALPQAEQAFVDSIHPDEEQLNEMVEKFSIGGKSGTPLYFTHDNRFLTKMVCESEYKFLIEFAEHYCDHMRTYPDSCLLRLCGVYRIQLRDTQNKFAFIVMSNVASLPGITRRYDLKGSHHNRSARQDTKHHGGKPEGALLDRDLVEDMQCGLVIRIKLADKRRLLQQLVFDVLFLAAMGVIDYSMLVCQWKPTSQARPSPDSSCNDSCPHLTPPEVRQHALHVFQGDSDGGEWYMVAIIDVSRKYGVMEAFENWAKTSLQRREQELVTVVPPYEYAERFLRKVNVYLQPELEPTDSIIEEFYCRLQSMQN